MLIKNDLYKSFVNEFAMILKSEVNKKQYDKVVFICVGTDRVTGDAFRTSCRI